MPCGREVGALEGVGVGSRLLDRIRRTANFTGWSNTVAQNSYTVLKVVLDAVESKQLTHSGLNEDGAASLAGRSILSRSPRVA